MKVVKITSYKVYKVSRQSGDLVEKQEVNDKSKAKHLARDWNDGNNKAIVQRQRN